MSSFPLSENLILLQSSPYTYRFYDIYSTFYSKHYYYNAF